MAKPVWWDDLNDRRVALIYKRRRRACEQLELACLQDIADVMLRHYAPFPTVKLPKPERVRKLLDDPKVGWPKWRDGYQKQHIGAGCGYLEVYNTQGWPTHEQSAQALLHIAIRDHLRAWLAAKGVGIAVRQCYGLDAVEYGGRRENASGEVRLTEWTRDYDETLVGTVEAVLGERT